MKLMKKLTFLFLLLLFPVMSWATSPLQPLAPQIAIGVGSQVLTGLNLATFSITWDAAVTPRYTMVFDGTVLPGNGSTTSCKTSHVTGCMLWCRYAVNSAVAPSDDWAVWSPTPLAAKFGLVVAMSTGAGCGTLTVDGSNDTFVSQAY
jgi:hypothetical protein